MPEKKREEYILLRKRDLNRYGLAAMIVEEIPHLVLVKTRRHGRIVLTLAEKGTQ